MEISLPAKALASAFECESLGDELELEILPLCRDDTLPKSMYTI